MVLDGVDGSGYTTGHNRGVPTGHYRVEDEDRSWSGQVVVGPWSRSWSRSRWVGAWK